MKILAKSNSIIFFQCRTKLPVYFGKKKIFILSYFSEFAVQFHQIASIQSFIARKKLFPRKFALFRLNLAYWILGNQSAST